VCKCGAARLCAIGAVVATQSRAHPRLRVLLFSSIEHQQRPYPLPASLARLRAHGATRRGAADPGPQIACPARAPLVVVMRIGVCAATPRARRCARRGRARVWRSS